MLFPVPPLLSILCWPVFCDVIKSYIWGAVLRQKFVQFDQSHGEIQYGVFSSPAMRDRFSLRSACIKTHFRGVQKRKGIMSKNTRLQRNDHQSLQGMIIDRWEMFTLERGLKSTAAQREIMLEAHVERCIIWQKRQVFLFMVDKLALQRF